MKHTESKLVNAFTKGLSHFYDCIDLGFGRANLDAEAIRFMNEMPAKLCLSHDDLLAALKVMTDQCMSLNWNASLPHTKEIDRKIKSAREAIAKAEK